MFSQLTETDLADAVAIWNEIVKEGLAFPQEDILTIGCWQVISRRTVFYLRCL